jgi:hypothetical protein
LDAIGYLLEKYSLFYLPAMLDTFGLGPRNLQEDDLVIPLELEFLSRCSLTGEMITRDRVAIVLRLENANEFKENTLTGTTPKAKILGPSFCCFGQWKRDEWEDLFVKRVVRID